VFELAELPPVGKCGMRSLAVKTLERRADGVIVPHSPVPPLSVIEFQFGEPRFDPRTKPWTSLVRSILLTDELRRLAARIPTHPLVAAFQPLLAESESELEQKAGGFFPIIKTSRLNQGVKEALEEVFMSWLGQGSAAADWEIDQRPIVPTPVGGRCLGIPRSAGCLAGGTRPMNGCWMGFGEQQSDVVGHCFPPQRAPKSRPSLRGEKSTARITRATGYA
jgi:hypothetical protein